MKNFKKLLALLCSLAILLTSLSTGFVFAAETDEATKVDYSSITFDTENGTTGNLSSSKWSFYDASEAPVGDNATKMLKVKTDATGNLAAWLLADGNNVAVESGKKYAISFDYYVDTGVNLTGITIRDSGAIVSDKSDSWGTVTANTLGLTTDGTAGEWKRIKLYFTADEDANLKVGITPKTATTDVFAYFDNFSLIELKEETANDYSNISFDTANGAAGNLNSGYWSFYDGNIAGNTSRLLKLNTNKSGNLTVNLTSGTEIVSIKNGKVYRLDFEYYADAGIDFKQLTIRTSSAAIATNKSASKVHNGSMMGITKANGTNGTWKKFRLYFTAPADSIFKLGVELNTATPDVFMYFDNFSLVELPTEEIDDYSDINFDTANGIAGSTGSSYVSFFDAFDTPIAGNDTRMLRYYAKGTDNAQFNLLYGGNAVALEPTEKYRLEFDIYAEAGIDISKATIRDLSSCLKDNVILPVTSEGTNGKWIRFTAFFTAGAESTALKLSIQSKTATNKYLYIDNISLTPFNSEEAITFEGKANGSAVDSSTSVWRYDTTAVAGNNTTKLVFSHTGMASGSVYNDFGDAVAVEKGYYYIIKFDYYIDAYNGTLGAIYNNDIGYKCNLDVTSENGTDGVWKTASSIFKATGSTEKFKFSVNPVNASNIKLYIDNVSIVMLYDCSVEAPEVLSTTPSNITLNVVEGYEYSVDGTHFSASGVFNNLNSETGIYPVYCREIITDNGYPSAPTEAVYVKLPYAGDIDKNNNLDANDTLEIRKRILGFEAIADDDFYDANRDKKVNVKDLVNIKVKISDNTVLIDETVVVRDGKTYTLAWNDDFIGSYIDRNNWADRTSDARHELQIFENDADNLFIDKDVEGNSCLVLQAVKTTDAEGKTVYTSGGVDTYGKFDFKTGYVEIRAKLPAGAGVWPGFWFGGTSNRDGETDWPENGEIDVFEFYGYKPNTVYHNFHYATYDEEGNVVANKIRNQEGEYCTSIDGDFTDDFHTFGCEWTEEYVAYYVDGVLSCKYEKDATVFEEINNEDMYLLVTLAIGGSDGAIADLENTEFPVQMAIDYVRYYK